MITSTNNPKIRLVRGLLAKKSERNKHRQFVMEGVRLCEEALSARWQPDLILFSDGLSDRGKDLVSEFQQLGVETDQVSDNLLKSISDTETPQGILGVCPQQKLSLPENPDFILICDGIRDPGNMGTLLRSAAAAGAQAVITTPGTTDPFAPKVVRSGMGAHFHIPVLNMTWEEIKSCASSDFQHRIDLFVAESESGTPYWNLDLSGPVGLIIGGEANGPSREAFEAAAGKIFIPMNPNIESLNAGIAASILLFEVVRQRST